MEIVENGDQHDVIREYYVDDENSRLKANQSQKHSYFLRAKTQRFLGYTVSDNDQEDGETKKMSSLLLPHHGSKSEEYPVSSEEEDLANCLVMLSNKSHHHKEENKAKEVVEIKGMFQCKACKKVFNSHQALGGHRASHKKVKGCFAAKLDGPNDEENVDDDLIQEDQEPFMQLESDSTQPTSTTSNRKTRPKMHECSVCRRVFSSGQALGGHKRCHWLATSSDNAFIANFHDLQYDQLCKKPMFTKPNQDHRDLDHQLDLNLNLPAPQLDDNNKRRFEGSTGLYLQQLTNQNQQKVEDEKMEQKGSCEMKLRKLSDLRDVNMDGGWLQMGIASTTDIC